MIRAFIRGKYADMLVSLFPVHRKKGLNFLQKKVARCSDKLTKRAYTLTAANQEKVRTEWFLLVQTNVVLI